MTFCSETRNLSALKQYPNNSRVHSQFQVDEIANSIKEFGFTNPILIDESDTVLAGHGRLQAARELGLVEVPVVVLEGLTDTQKKAYVIADNKLALNASWDEELLKQEVYTILEDKEEDTTYLELIGFNDDEIQELLSNDKKTGFNNKKQLEQQADDLLSTSNNVGKLQIVVTVLNECEQESLLKELQERGYNCKQY